MIDISKFTGKVAVRENEFCSGDVLRMRLTCPEIGEKAEPGQFVMVKAADQQSDDPLLPRPFSVHRADPEGFEILYKVVGKGTRSLGRLKAGGELSVYGPLGNGFTLESGGSFLLVGGGIGVAPLLFLAERLKAAGPPVDLRIVIGAGSAGEIVEEDRFGKLGTNGIEVATEDGSRGLKGLVTDLLFETGNLNAARMVYTCGPLAMLEAVNRWCLENSLSCQVSTETVMACGIGACLGCAVEGAGRPHDRYLHVCMDGPVFDSRQLWSL